VLDTVWGPKSLRHRLRAAAYAGGAGSGSLSVFDACTGCDIPGTGEELVVLLVAFLAVALLWFLIRLAIDLVRRWRNRLRPYGAVRPGPRFARKAPTGTIAAGASVASDPITGRPCVAFGVELVCSRGVMLRDGATVGFAIELDSGERVEVPPGACVIDVSQAKRLRRPALAEYEADLDPHKGALPLFPATVARHAVLEPGDRVEVHGELEVTADGRANVGYRDAALVLAPAGIACLRPGRASAR